MSLANSDLPESLPPIMAIVSLSCTCKSTGPKTKEGLGEKKFQRLGGL